MTLYEFADIINREIVVRRYPNQNERWIAEFEHCEVSEGAILHGVYGTGKTPILALSHYVSLIRGKKLVFDAMSTDRLEFVCPKIIEAIIVK